jgi:hypothetical protein
VVVVLVFVSVEVAAVESDEAGTFPPVNTAFDGFKFHQNPNAR